MTAKNTSKEQKLIQLRGKLAKQEAYNRLNKSADYQEHLLPVLKAAVNNKWIDPGLYSSRDEFFDAYTVAHGKAKAYTEIINKLAGAKDNAERLVDAMDPKKQEKYEI